MVVLFCTAVVIAAPAQSGVFTDLANFDGTNGAEPTAGLVQGTDGNFYGTTPYGGAWGTVFRLTADGTLTTLYSFCSQSNCTDGALPFSGLVQGSDGNFYGTTWFRGDNEYCNGDGCGTVFKVTPEGVLTTLHSFDGADGTNPGDLVQATDGNFYGTTYGGGAYENCSHGCGTVFKMTSTGAFTTVHRFNGLSDGLTPDGLVQATDGNFYGTGLEANFGYGMIFKMTPGGVLSRLYTFCRQPHCADGGDPNPLIQASDGNFYATTYGGGANNYGTVFKMTLAGSLTTLYSFCSQPNCADGGAPLGRLLQASDGILYGTTSNAQATQCGIIGCGTVFKITLVGRLTTLHTFDLTHGADPEAGLVQVTHGNFYGTTGIGGNLGCNFPAGCGTVFRLAARGVSR
jgi:uncharacterized repeat protein (TIGR03803 family)